MPLSDTAIRGAKPDPSRTIKLSDGGGLQLWVQPTGAKLWNLAYRFGGKQRKLAIGPYAAIGLKDARDRRDAAKRLLIDGIDPSQNKRTEKLASEAQKANSFEAISRELLDKKRREGKADATLAKVEWLIGLALPDLGPRPIAEICAPEVLATLRKVEVRGRLETARRMRATIGEVFRYAVATGRAQGDPTGALRGALTTPQVTHRAAIIDPKGLGELLRAVEGHAGAPEVRMALQLLALTFTRPGELRMAEWTEFDLVASVWTIPGKRMKMRRPHRVPLSRQTLDLLSEVRKISGNRTLVFPGARDPKRPLSENTLNAALRRLGYSKDEMTAHGFRAAASSILNESGKWNADAIEAQLAHVERNSIRRAYARAEFWDERIRLMDHWANLLDEIRNQ
ncbi:tyrosine-type recombinase/integrase [Methylocystis sp. H62]|uniref:tyrosine-type recombinase/integrase n=1 Tax=Methylocystis sp. H62 TaxID=2785789 RepID=UPI0018C2B123|nr:integrase arm-type DNA-binding domain-containing protein [Methylocystis sp. H62]MBG0794734.1 tyrosine-type recombinase/integrase [Methylocystis sp. H62]